MVARRRISSRRDSKAYCERDRSIPAIPCVEIEMGEVGNEVKGSSWLQRRRTFKLCFGGRGSETGLYCCLCYLIQKHMKFALYGVRILCAAAVGCTSGPR